MQPSTSSQASAQLFTGSRTTPPISSPQPVFSPAALMAAQALLEQQAQQQQQQQPQQFQQQLDMYKNSLQMQSTLRDILSLAQLMDGPLVSGGNNNHHETSANKGNSDASEHMQYLNGSSSQHHSPQVNGLEDGSADIVSLAMSTSNIHPKFRAKRKALVQAQQQQQANNSSNDHFDSSHYPMDLSSPSPQSSSSCSSVQSRDNSKSNSARQSVIMPNNNGTNKKSNNKNGKQRISGELNPFIGTVSGTIIDCLGRSNESVTSFCLFWRHENVCSRRMVPQIGKSSKGIRSVASHQSSYSVHMNLPSPCPDLYHRKDMNQARPLSLSAVFALGKQGHIQWRHRCE